MERTEINNGLMVIKKSRFYLLEGIISIRVRLLKLLVY